MRTTIDIPDPLYKELKVRAAKQGRTVKEIILSGVQKEMQDLSRKKQRVRLPLLHGKGTRKIANVTGVQVDEILFG